MVHLEWMDLWGPFRMDGLNGPFRLDGSCGVKPAGRGNQTTSAQCVNTAI